MKLHSMAFCTNETGMTSLRMYCEELRECRISFSIETDIPNPGGSTATFHEVTWFGDSNETHRGTRGRK